MDNELNKLYKKTSRLLSQLLRHKPEMLKIDVDKNGWAKIDQIITNAKIYWNKELTYDLIKIVVDTNDKKRFTISADGKKIRANQGHSIPVDLELEPKIPPDILYHGTSKQSLASIMKEGLLPRGRQYVHLSLDKETALIVGKRKKGEAVILTINAKKMYEEGIKFYLSENNIWMTDKVPPEYITQK